MKEQRVERKEKLKVIVFVLKIFEHYKALRKSPCSTFHRRWKNPKGIK